MHTSKSKKKGATTRFEHTSNVFRMLLHNKTWTETLRALFLLNHKQKDVKSNVMNWIKIIQYFIYIQTIFFVFRASLKLLFLRNIQNLHADLFLDCKLTIAFVMNIHFDVLSRNRMNFLCIAEGWKCENLNDSCDVFNIRWRKFELNT